MPAFNAKRQALELLSPFISHTPKPRPEKRKGNKKIRAVSTKHTYTGTMTAIARWQKKEHGGTLHRMTRQHALQYLEGRSHVVSQKTLDRDRVVLQFLPRTGKSGLPRIKSSVDPGALSTESRAYEHAQLAQITSRQGARNALSTELSWRCGWRAHELLTVRRWDSLTKEEQEQLLAHGKWDPRIWENRPGEWYVVDGKGGLDRISVVPPDLVERLEARKLPEGGRIVQDREIDYRQFYDLAGGVKWSSSFSKASQRCFGWSSGGHGCRHTYAQDRYSAYRAEGMDPTTARELVAQEMGHFRDRVTMVYLR